MKKLVRTPRILIRGWRGYELGRMCEVILRKYRHDNDSIDIICKLGEVFGSSDEFHRKVLAEFIENLAFEDQDLVNSLRRFLTYFQLPGEGE